MPSKRKLRAVVLTALPVEYEAVRRHLSEPEPRLHPGGSRYEVGGLAISRLLEWEILIAEIGAGNATAAAEAERALGFFKPDLALFVGVAGGLKDVEVGDVVVADQVYGYHSGKAAATFQTRPDVGRSSYAAVQTARVVRRQWNRHLGAPHGNAFVGKIAAGEAVISATTSETHQFLRQNYGDAIAVEMEGRGFLGAMHMNANVLSLVIRGISDRVDGKEVADRSGSQERASARAAEFAVRLIKEMTAQLSSTPSTGSRPRAFVRTNQTPPPETRRRPGSHVSDGDSPLQMFVSSRIGAGLDHERRGAANAIESLSTGLARAWLWERDGIAGRSVRDLCIEAARRSDVLILLVQDDVSPIVQAEFKAARAAGAHCLVFAKPGGPMTARCLRFMKKLGRWAILPRNFQNASELESYLVEELHRKMREALRAGRGTP